MKPCFKVKTYEKCTIYTWTQDQFSNDIEVDALTYTKGKAGLESTYLKDIRL